MNPPPATRQIGFHRLLVAARKKWFLDALSETLGGLDQLEVKRQITAFVPVDSQSILARAGLRDEYVFPLPIVLTAAPSLVGYYRMLLGASQKAFYQGSTGLARFRTMEERGLINKRQEKNLPGFCRGMASRLTDLVRGIPDISERDLRELPILIYGSQLQGSNNTRIGQKAMENVFLAITEVVNPYVKSSQPTRLIVANSAGREVYISLSHDPDVAIQELVGSRPHNRVAIEVKGGADNSNQYNRIGEAEKSHLIADEQGFHECWTILSKKHLRMFDARKKSPTTTQWFDIDQLLARKGEDWNEFRARLATAVGIPLAD